MVQKITIWILLLSLGTLASCNSYQKVLKSTDFEYKYTKTKEYYNSGAYFKAIPLFEELMTVYKGTKNVEKLYYFYAYTHYGQGDYLLAAHYFRTFLNYYPKSTYAEDAQFMAAFCLYKMSPVTTLEQTQSEKAIEAFQLYINAYPNSERVARSNDLIDEMRVKLEQKAFESANLYYRLGSYRAASVSFANLLLEFSDTDRKEEIMYLIVKSRYLLAKNSIVSKQEERYTETINSYLDLVDKFPDSSYAKEAESIYTACLENIEKTQAIVKQNKKPKGKQKQESSTNDTSLSVNP